jgi:calcineurin-like phosphoesterase family protein
MILTLYEPFRHWSDGGKVWIYSDPHFDDPLSKRMDPEWPDARTQVKKLNKYIGKQDTFVCLGDVGDPSCADYIQARYKVLILGNHDKRGACRDHFDEVYDGPVFVAEKLLLSHEPVYGLPWCVNVHGHDHGNKEVYAEGCRHVNLAANICGFVPMDLGAEIKKGLLSHVPGIHRMVINQEIGTPTTLREPADEEIDLEHE